MPSVMHYGDVSRGVKRATQRLVPFVVNLQSLHASGTRTAQRELVPKAEVVKI